MHYIVTSYSVYLKDLLDITQDQNYIVTYDIYLTVCSTHRFSLAALK